MLRVLVVDDSKVARLMVAQILHSDPDLSVVGEAEDGAEAVEKAAKLKPDIITMDVHMPVMDGLEATRRIMEQSPTPIVVVSASADRENLTKSFDAIEAGALTILEKPSGPGRQEFAEQARDIVTTVKLMADVKVIRRAIRPGERRMPTPAPALRQSVEIAAIAASTGGPSALTRILGSLNRDTPVPILAVQHIARGFDQGLVEWLDRSSNLPVRLAEHGSPLRPGHVFLAPNDFHLGLGQNGQLSLQDDPPIGGHRPSATFLFSSIAKAYGSRAMGVVLTGMGQDGARGLLELRRAGGWTLAQDEATSVVYGMPKAAIEAGAVARVLPLDEIAEAMTGMWRR